MTVWITQMDVFLAANRDVIQLGFVQGEESEQLLALILNATMASESV